MRLLLIFFLYNTVVFAEAQQLKSFNLEKWDSISKRKANTAANIDYLSYEEKMVIFTTNLARINGPLFIETILDPFLEGKPKTKYTRSLHKELSKLKELLPLHPQKDLYSIANEHAVKSGKKGSVGHDGFDRRFKPLMGKYNMVAENCAYGFEEGMTNAIQLLIDEGISNLGHRKNMLSPHFNSIGVSIQAHKKYRFNCVMEFGKLTD